MPKRVLVVDDSPTIRKIVQLCLAEAEIEFDGVAGGKQAVTSLKKSVPDLVLADVAMPAPDGYDLCARIKDGEFGKIVPVVLLADPFDPFDTERAQAASADGYVAKPFDAKTLLTMVGDHLGISMSGASGPVSGSAAADDATLLEEEVPVVAQGAPGTPRVEARMSEEEIEAIARRVVTLLSQDVVREIAWEVVPDLSEILIREKMEQTR